MNKTYVLRDEKFPIYLKVRDHEGYLYVINISDFSVSETYLRSKFEKQILPRLKEITEKEDLVAIHIMLEGSLYPLLDTLKEHGFQLNDDMLSMVYSFFKRVFGSSDTYKTYTLPPNLIITTFDDSYIDDWVETIKNAFKHKECFNLLKRNFTTHWTSNVMFDKKLHLQVIDKNTGKVIGLISCFYYPEKKSAHIKLVAVRKNYQNKGIGKFMIQEILKILNKKSCNYVSLDVNALNSSAVHVYLKMGFEIRNNLSLTKVYFNPQRAKTKLRVNS